MPNDVSSSSDEASDTQEVPQKRRKQASRYQCPADFVEFAHKPCASTLIERVCEDNTELWLIKAPSSFNLDSFSSLKMPLSGLQTMQAPAQQTHGGGNTRQIYSVLGGPSGAADLRLLTSHPQTLNLVVCAPAFSGLLNICESYGDCSTNQTPIAIPATPAPTVPPGLRQRFQPFGSRTPTLSRLMEDTPDTPLSSTPETPLRVTLDPGEERKSKKKKKKDQLIKTEEEMEEVVRVKQELLEMTHSPEEPYELPGQEAELSEEKRKKKKKKKDKDRGKVEDTVYSSFNVIKEEVEVKVEPMDSSYGEVEDSGKRKKKMKRNRHDDD
ncbi:DNA-directed RNA polymerase I subunit RPA34 [Salmo salar]|uniref:DNA-directed RNA polymerase I subunit RPA34 n=1 Tax=Salmo salar TaxID=8030 RepID=A0A1S3SZ25_SALSA|nr:CD3e molecule, epsilon associated protein [Salmo salar]|eukprot:XP_014069595.1 PREDICTED: DNA-directed RNA polymerase I subunit RPA34-like [Salmo salar]